MNTEKNITKLQSIWGWLTAEDDHTQMQKNLDGLFDMINELKGEIVEIEGELTASQKTSEERKVALEYANSQIKGMAAQLGNQSQLIVKLAREKHGFAEQLNKDSWYIAELNKKLNDLQDANVGHINARKDMMDELEDMYERMKEFFGDSEPCDDEDEDIDDIDEFR